MKHGYRIYDKEGFMKKARTKDKRVTQTSNRTAVSQSAAPLQSESGNIEKPGRSTLASSGLDTPVGPANTSLSLQQITERARAIWEQTGRAAGQDHENWCEAEAQLRAAL
jgi:hypothetical protein